MRNGQRQTYPFWQAPTHSPALVCRRWLSIQSSSFAKRTLLGDVMFNLVDSGWKCTTSGVDEDLVWRLVGEALSGSMIEQSGGGFKVLIGDG